MNKKELLVCVTCGRKDEPSVFSGGDHLESVCLPCALKKMLSLADVALSEKEFNEGEQETREPVI